VITCDDCVIMSDPDSTTFPTGTLSALAGKSPVQSYFTLVIIWHLCSAKILSSCCSGADWVWADLF
jgi:hypothetical protein